MNPRFESVVFILGHALKWSVRNWTVSVKKVRFFAWHANDQFDRASFVYQQEEKHQIDNAKVCSTALGQMEVGINGLQSGLKIVTSAVDALAVRALHQVKVRRALQKNVFAVKVALQS